FRYDCPLHYVNARTHRELDSDFFHLVFKLRFEGLTGLQISLQLSKWRTIVTQIDRLCFEILRIALETVQLSHHGVPLLDQFVQIARLAAPIVSASQGRFNLLDDLGFHFSTKAV